jgi:hypothetical protein
MNIKYTNICIPLQGPPKFIQNCFFLGLKTNHLAYLPRFLIWGDIIWLNPLAAHPKIFKSFDPSGTMSRQYWTWYAEEITSDLFSNLFFSLFLLEKFTMQSLETFGSLSYGNSRLQTQTPSSSVQSIFFVSCCCFGFKPNLQIKSNCC